MCCDLAVTLLAFLVKRSTGLLKESAPERLNNWQGIDLPLHLVTESLLT